MMLSSMMTDEDHSFVVAYKQNLIHEEHSSALKSH